MTSDHYGRLPENLRDVLWTNDPIESGQAKVLSEYVLQREMALEHYRTEVTEVAHQLSALLEKQRQLQQQISREEQDISACRRRLSLSIWALPTEILQIIFTYSVPSAEMVCNRHASTYHNQAPFTLVQVSRRWRDVALAFPSLWTSFSMRSFYGSNLLIPNFAAFREMVKTHYSRSEGLAKSLYFHLESVDLNASRDSTSLCNPASSVFNDDIQIGHLTLASSCISELLHALGRPCDWWTKATLQSVESLVLTSDVPCLSPQSPINVLSRTRLKSLRRLTLHSGPFLTERIWDTYFIPWNNLTHIAITSWIRHLDWIEFFPMFTGMQHGIFYIKHDEAWEPAAHVYPIHNFARLLDLTLIFHNELATTVAFEPYRLPNLQHVRLGAYRQPFNLKAFDLANLESGLAKLTSLSLYHLSWEAPVHSIAEILVITANLKSLSLGISMNYDQLLEHFQIDWNGFALLPRLESFTIDCVASGYGGGTPLSAPMLLVLTADGFTSMVKDRWRPLETVSRLSEVSLFLAKGHERVLSTIEGNLRREVEEGLGLTVTAAGGTGAAPRQWVDPLERRVTHWHEGLVLPEKSDCASCLEIIT